MKFKLLKKNLNHANYWDAVRRESLYTVCIEYPKKKIVECYVSAG